MQAFRPAVAALRNFALGAVSRIPGTAVAGQKVFWIPDARYGDGFFARARRTDRAVGWLIPQPWVTADGRRAVSASEDHTVKVWDLQSGRCIDTVYGVAPYDCVCVDEERICAGDRVGNVWMLVSAAVRYSWNCGSAMSGCREISASLNFTSAR